MENALLYSLFAMVILTLIVGVRLLLLRIRAVRQNGLSPAYFYLNQGGKPPACLVQTTQHYENLFELPVLFYVVVLLIHSLQQVDGIYVVLAWLYVLSRFVHGWIHMTYNALAHRRRVFLASVVVLYGLWARLFVDLLIR